MTIFVGFNPRRCTHWMWSILVIVLAILTPLLAFVFTVFMIPFWGFIIDLMPLEMQAAQLLETEERNERAKAKQIKREKEFAAREARYRQKWNAAFDEARRRKGLVE